MRTRNYRFTLENLNAPPSDDWPPIMIRISGTAPEIISLMAAAIQNLIRDVQAQEWKSDPTSEKGTT